MILIDLHTEEGIVGRSYLELYLERSVSYLIPAIRDLAEMRKGQRIAPFDDFGTGRARLNLIGLEGMSMIAVSGLDMAAWDAPARTAELPLAVLLGGSLAPVAAYNSNGLWLTPVSELGEQAAALLAEGKFQGLRLRLGRDQLADDIAAIQAVRGTVGEGVRLMVDFNQGLSLGDSLHRCHALDDPGLYWFEADPVVEREGLGPWLSPEARAGELERKPSSLPGDESSNPSPSYIGAGLPPEDVGELADRHRFRQRAWPAGRW